ncbi:MAG: heavy metal translocating P-type ATPase metal-binding domain-containing protein, partial [Bacteroidales bacterium]|nr:heavy metal translocating P-type ATPase metal-binding domain-containing protein [Bacteroidales bacterium]
MASGEKCVHCGADCGKRPVEWNNLFFCCNGCKQVYQLLNEKKLYSYYTIEDTPGIRTETFYHSTKYEYLDKDEVKEKIYDFFDNNIAKITLYIPSIHCASCIWLLENLNRLNKGIIHSSVNFVKKELSVTFNTDQISLREVAELLTSIHYTPDISLKNLESKTKDNSNKMLLYKIGVAGFVFGNVMLYSLPEYFNGEPLNESLGSFLYYLSFILCIPLVFFSGSDYLVSAFKNLIKGIINIDLPIALGILTLFGVSSWEIISGSGSGYSDSLSGFLFFLLLGKWYQSKTYQALAFDRDYKSYFPVAVTRITPEGEHSALLSELSKGDKILIRNRELIPADSQLIKGNALIDYSFVTGESRPVEKSQGDKLYAGGIQSGGSITVEIEKEIMQSHLTSLWNQSKEDDKAKTNIKGIIDRVSVWFTLVIIVIALSGFGWWLISDSLSKAILVLTSVLIVACPCALALTIPFTFGNVMRMLGLKGLYIKNISVIERIIKVDSIVFDKTGTLTQPDGNSVRFVGKDLSAEEIDYAYSLARQSTHPLSAAISNSLKPQKIYDTPGFVEVAGRGVFANINKLKVKLGSCEYVRGNTECNAKETTSVYLSIGDKTMGYFEIGNMYRKGYAEVLKKLGSAFKLYLLSGDNDSERRFLESHIPSGNIHFNQDPIQKRDFISELKSGKSTVLMTGDGLNDSGAFMKSDVALSVADDIYHFSPAGDAILDAASFHKLPAFIKYCKRSLTIVRISFLISFLYNIAGLSFALSG